MGRRKATKGDYGNGSIYQDKKSGRWIVQVYDGHGKLIRRRAPSREVAEKLQTELNRLKGKNINVRGGMQTVEQLANTWFREVKVPAGLKATTLEHYQHQIEYYVIPYLGKHLVEEVKGETIQAFVNWLRKVLSNQSIRHVIQVLRQIFDLAVRWRYVEYNPVHQADQPKVRRPEYATMTMPEARSFLEGLAGQRCEALYHLAITLGMRRGELLGLRWIDINWQERTIRIAQQLVELNHKPTFTTPKSDTSARVLPFTARMETLLRAHWQRQQQERAALDVQWQEHGLVFPGETGKPYLPVSITKQFRVLSKRAGFEGLHFHLMRHVAASSLAEIGISEIVIGAILGHSGKTVTRRYIQVTLPTMRKAIEDVERALWATEAGQKEDTA